MNWRNCAQDPDRHMATAIDEVIRWVTPVRQFMRTATADCSVGGRRRRRRPGVRAVVSVGEPGRSRCSTIRSHFGWTGASTTWPSATVPHVCLGQHLARMEMAALYRELLRRVDHVELNGEPAYSQSGRSLAG